MNTAAWKELPSRRDFMKAGGVVIAGMSVGAPLVRAAGKDESSDVVLRFGIVTDMHYADAPPRYKRFYRKSSAKLRECVELMNHEKVSFLVELGDMKDQNPKPARESTLRYLAEIETVFCGFKGARYHVPGNHDMDSISKADFMGAVQNSGIAAGRSFYSFDTAGLHFIVLDANYTKAGHDYNSGDFDWRDANIPKPQLDWLKTDLKTSAAPAIVFVHQLLDGAGDMYINNAVAVRKVLEESGRVLAVFQGHHHDGSYSLINKIHYYTLKALVDGEKKEDNAYAIVEVQRSGDITVKGYRRAVNYSLHHA